MESADEEPAYGVTHYLGSYTSEQLCFKIKPVLLNSNRIEYGINKHMDGKNVCGIACIINKTNYTIISNIGINAKSLYELQLPEDFRFVGSEFAVEVNTESRTIRFFLNGEQKHDGDIAIHLTREQLKAKSWFHVSLFAPGDCVRIID